MLQKFAAMISIVCELYVFKYVHHLSICITRVNNTMPVYQSVYDDCGPKAITESVQTSLVIFWPIPHRDISDVVRANTSTDPRVKELM